MGWLKTVIASVLGAVPSIIGAIAKARRDKREQQARIKAEQAAKLKAAKEASMQRVQDAVERRIKESLNAEKARTE